MNATDELRRLLDGRGVEWMPSAWSARDETFYKVGNTGFLATEMSGGRMKVCIEGYVAPEQAVEATLGSGIVRCRDCKRFAVDQSDHEYRSGWWCHRWNTDMVKPDGFCAWASRKEDE